MVGLLVHYVAFMIFHPYILYPAMYSGVQQIKLLEVNGFFSNIKSYFTDILVQSMSVICHI